MSLLLDSDLLDDIYEAAFVPETWRAVLDRLGEMAGAWGAALLAVDRRQDARFIATERYQPLFERFMREASRYDNVRPQRALAMQYAGFQADWELCTPEELRTDPIYRDFLRPEGLGWSMGTVIPAPTRDLLIFDLLATEERGPFTRETAERLDAYRPHLARSALLAARLALERARTAALTLEIVGLPAAVLAREERVVAANPLFESLAPAIRVGARDRLKAADPATERLLRQSLSEARMLDTASSLPLAGDGEHAAAVLHVVPLRRQALDLFRGAYCFLVATPIAAAEAPAVSLLAGLFDLTPAEARVARAIAQGQTLKQAAAFSGVTRETVKGQLKAVMGKTGTTRQAELVRLLAGLGPTPRLPAAG